MIETLDGFPEGIIAFRAKGLVTKRDYDDVLLPKAEEAFGRHAKLRFYYELGTDFSGIQPGAMWEDLKLGIEHFSRWQRIAVVTDVEWIRLAVNLFRFLVPGKTRLFAMGEAAEARRWIAAT